MPTDGDAIQHASSSHHKIGGPRTTTSACLTIAHLFSWTVLTRPKNEVITFFLLCLASIDATLTAIVGDRLLPYWYSTIAAGGICVPTLCKSDDSFRKSFHFNSKEIIDGSLVFNIKFCITKFFYCRINQTIVWAEQYTIIDIYN